MSRNLFCTVSLCFLILMVSCSDGEDEPSMDVVTEPTDDPEEKVANPDVGNLGRTDPGAENVENPDPGEEMHPPEPELVEPEVEGVNVVLHDAIDEVLERLRDGYENEDLELYLSAFWISVYLRYGNPP